jgi:hypothetical protein
MKTLFIGLACCFSLSVNAEIVTNSKGEKIKLKSNGTWSKVKSKSVSNKSVSDKDVLMLGVKDGNDKIIKIQTFVRFEGSNITSINEENLRQLVDLTGFREKLWMKNEYSFTPKIAMATFKDGLLEIYLRYTGENSYGAEVVDSALYN